MDAKPTGFNMWSFCQRKDRSYNNFHGRLHLKYVKIFYDSAHFNMYMYYYINKNTMPKKILSDTF